MKRHFWDTAGMTEHVRDQQHGHTGTSRPNAACLLQLQSPSVHGEEARLTMWQKTLMTASRSAHHAQNGLCFSFG
ncbi:hypothetical protein EYF80_050492 [Liparis tanakae]|uniref:Uncharacterized protein n=1 Tax=Liparis tanakae TaxID=230148 RepID=A0A4Z2FF29_9TELE|nr:hypothetical protein EYF80_050492 [Liparis tanakae]